MSFYKEVPGRKTTLESTLKFDTTPTAGSTNPITSDGVKGAIDGAVGDASEALQQQIDEIAEKAGSGYIPKGEADVATLNGLSGQENGWLYTMTDAGTLTLGSLSVVAGDTVAWDEANSVWYKTMDYAPRQYGTNEINNLPTTITAFRSGDYIAVGGTTPAKMSKDNLLLVTKENAVSSDLKKQISSFSVVAGTAYSNTRNVYDSATPIPKGTIIDMVYTPSVEGLLADTCGFYGVTDGGTSVWFGNFVAQTRLVLPYNLLRFGFSWNASQAKKTGTFNFDVTFHTSVNTRLNDVSEVVEGITSKEIFRNPIFTTYSIADPAVFDGGDGWFYCFQTSVISSNVTNRKMIRSTNLVDWEESDDPISNETRAIIAGMSDATNFYAPHIIKIGDYFNMYISLQNEAMIVLRSKSPNGFYEFVGDPYVLVGPDNTPVGNSYEDAFVALDRDGQLWLFYGSHGNIVRRKLESDGLHVADNVETHVAGIIGEVGVDNPGEGPTLYRKGGYWWLFYGRGNWMNDTYSEYVGRSETLGGTFVNKNGQSLTEAVGELVLDKKGTPYRGAAHIGDIIVDRENHYFANVPSYNPNLETGKRSLCLTEIKWGDDGWPEYHELSFGSQKRPVF